MGCDLGFDYDIWTFLEEQIRLRLTWHVVKSWKHTLSFANIYDSAELLHRVKKC